MNAELWSVLTGGAPVRLRLELESGVGEAGISVVRDDGDPGLSGQAEAVLGPEERAYYGRVLAERRRRGFLMGRLAAKRALAALGALGGEGDSSGWSRVDIGWGVFQQPVVAGLAGGYGVSIAHTDGSAIAVAFPEGHPMGVDVERVRGARERAVVRVLTEAERAVAPGPGWNGAEVRFAFWCAREALSKVLRCGLACSSEVLAVRDWESDGEEWQVGFRHFPGYRTEGTRRADLMFALVLPRRTKILATFGPLACL